MASFVPHIGTLEHNRDEAVALAPADQKRHVYIAGKSGTGKSTLLRNMIVANLSSGDGLTLLRFRRPSCFGCRHLGQRECDRDVEPEGFSA